MPGARGRSAGGLNRLVDLLADRRLHRDRVIFAIVQPVPHLHREPAVDIRLEHDLGGGSLAMSGRPFSWSRKRSTSPSGRLPSGIFAVSVKSLVGYRVRLMMVPV